MNTTDPTEEVQFERDTRVCRHSDWMDVLTFLAINFGLRAVTVLTPPGSTGLQSALTCLWALFSPAYGVRRAFLAVGIPENDKDDSELEDSIRNAWRRIKARVVSGERRSELEMALRSGALCMLVPTTVRCRSRLRPKARSDSSINRQTAADALSKPTTSGREPLPLETIDTLMTTVHGQYPTYIKDLSIPLDQEDPESGKPPPPFEYSLVKVPSSFKVVPIITEDDPKPLIKSLSQRIGNDRSLDPVIQERPPAKAVPLRLSSNERIVMAIGTIFQILYGSYELYRIGGDHLKRYGYAAYEFTIIPYLSMSVMNLLVSCVRPTYPAIYIVHYRGIEPPSADGAGSSNEPSSDYNERSRAEPEITPTGGNQNADETQLPNYPEYWWRPSHTNFLETQVSGAIGFVYGDFAKDNDGPSRRVKPHYFFSISTWKKRVLANPFFAIFILAIYILLYYAAPYIVIQVLTGFDRGKSTPLQRGCIIMWIASGQICPDFIEIIARLLPKRPQRSPSLYPYVRMIILGFLHIALIGVPTCAGVYMVTTMILEGNTCTEL